MSNNLISYLNKRLTHLPPDDSPGKPPGPVITISRQVGCSGQAFAHALSKRLNETTRGKTWKVLSKEILHRSARELNLDPSRVAKIYKQEERTAVDEIIAAFSEKRFKSDKKIKKTVMEVIRHYGEEGYCIIVGRAGNIITSGIKNSLHIRLEAPVEDRIATIMQKTGKNRNDAILFIEQQEKERYAYRHAYMTGSADEPEIFDISFNRSEFTTDMIIDMIMLAVSEKELLNGYEK